MAVGCRCRDVYKPLVKLRVHCRRDELILASRMKIEPFGRMSYQSGVFYCSFAPFTRKLLRCMHIATIAKNIQMPQ